MGKPSIKKNTNSYLKYSGIAFQMAGLIALGFFLGNYIDTKFGFSVPVFTLTLILLFFSGFMFKLYQELMQKK